MFCRITSGGVGPRAPWIRPPTSTRVSVCVSLPFCAQNSFLHSGVRACGRFLLTREGGFAAVLFRDDSRNTERTDLAPQVLPILTRLGLEPRNSGFVPLLCAPGKLSDAGEAKENHETGAHCIHKAFSQLPRQGAG